MLVLTRKKEQRIQIGRHITVTIVRVKGGAVRVGIEAPPDVKILRGELSALPPSPEEHEAAGTPPDRSSGAAVRAASRWPRHASGSEATDSGDEGAASTDPPPGLTETRRPALKRGPVPPGLPGSHGIWPARPAPRRSPALLQ